MARRVTGRLDVATCIACGARSRPGACEGGCSDVPLELVDADAVDAQAARVAALERRADALRSALAQFAATDADWEAARRAGHEALRLEVPAPAAEPAVVAAWGCPECGRVDAPQPCLDVCIRRPVPMADVAEWRELAAAGAAVEERDRELTELVRLIVHVRPRAGQAERSRRELAGRAQALLAGDQRSGAKRSS